MKRLFGADNPDVAISLNNLAELYYNQGKVYRSGTPLQASFENTETNPWIGPSGGCDYVRKYEGSI